MTFLRSPGAFGDHASTPDTAALDITGDLRIVLRARGEGNVAGKWETTGNQRSWQLYFDAGQVLLTWSTNGSATADLVVTAALPVTDWVWLDVLLDVSDGGNHDLTVRYSTDDTDDPDAVTWTALGSDSGAGTTSIFASTASLFAASGENDDAGFAGDLRVLQLTADPLGTPNVVAYPRFSDETAGTTSFTDAEGLTWTVNGAAEIVEPLTIPLQFNLAPVIAGVAVPGPVFFLEEIIPGLAVSLHRWPDLDQVAVFDPRDTDGEVGYAETFQVRTSEPGTGAITLPIDVHAAVAPQIGDVLRARVDGWVQAESLVEDIAEHTLDLDQAKRSATLAGRTIDAVTEMGLIIPGNGVDVNPPSTDRLFSWQSWQFDPVGWVNGTDAGAAEVTPRIPGIQSGYPEGAPDIAGALWIWAEPGTPYFAPGGGIYVIEDIEFPYDGDYMIGIAIDNYGPTWFDGIPILTLDQSGGVQNYLQVHTVTLPVSAGVHRLAAQPSNKAPQELAPGAPANPGGFYYFVARVGASGELIDIISYSTTNMLVLGYPDQAPGMTPGQAVLIALDEIQTASAYTGRTTLAAGGAQQLTPTFTEAVDSDGRPWPIYGDIATKNYNTLLTFLTELAGAGYVKWRVDPGAMTLSMYVGDRTVPTGVTLEPAVLRNPLTGNLVGLDRRRT